MSRSSASLSSDTSRSSRSLSGRIRVAVFLVVASGIDVRSSGQHEPAESFQGQRVFLDGDADGM